MLHRREVSRNVCFVIPPLLRGDKQNCLLNGLGNWKHEFSAVCVVMKLHGRPPSGILGGK